MIVPYRIDNLEICTDVYRSLYAVPYRIDNLEITDSKLVFGSTVPYRIDNLEKYQELDRGKARGSLSHR